MQRPLTADLSMILTVLTVAGMLMALAAFWPLEGEVAAYSWLIGLAVVYLAGGLPASWRALEALWKEHIFDIDLLMVVAAVAARWTRQTSRVNPCQWRRNPAGRSSKRPSIWTEFSKSG